MDLDRCAYQPHANSITNPKDEDPFRLKFVGAKGSFARGKATGVALGFATRATACDGFGHDLPGSFLHQRRAL